MNSFISSSDTLVIETAEAQPPSFRRYLTWTTVSIILMMCGVFSIIAWKGEELPPPPFSGSISFDEKAVWLANRLHEPCDILAIGSSMTLNNLHGSSIEERHVLNTASWGLKVVHTEAFLDLTLEFVEPQTIIMLTTPVDFEHDYRKSEIYDRKLLGSFFTSRNLFQAHVKTLSLNYLMAEFKSIQEDRDGRKTYYSLDFDQTGSVPLASQGFERIDERWNEPITTGSGINDVNYAAIERIAKRCKESRIRFLLIQSPIREDILRPSDPKFLAAHWERLEAACENHQQQFLNFHGKLAMNESDFADGTHLNESGARKLTAQLIEAASEEAFIVAH